MIKNIIIKLIYKYLNLSSYEILLITDYLDNYMVFLDKYCDNEFLLDNTSRNIYNIKKSLSKLFDEVQYE